MQRQSTVFAVPAQITNEIDALCQAADRPLSKDQYKAIYHLITTLLTRGVITPITADQISEISKLIRE